MKDLWKHHVKYYDLFQMNRNSYIETLDFFIKEMGGYKKILDSGAGSGNLTLGLLKKRHIVIAIDSNSDSLKVLKEKCKKFKAKLVVKVMDVQKMNFTNESFNAVSSMFVVPFVKNNKKYFTEVYRILRERGKFIISSWAPVKDTWKGIMETQEKELTEKRILPKHKKDWDFINRSSKEAIKKVSSAPDLKNLKTLLKKVGFKYVKSVKHPYGKYAYLITCQK